MPSQRALWEIYNNEMSLLCNGHALWEPAPLTYFDRIRLGDVGYIRDGCFNLLFSASCAPPPLKQLDIGRILFPQPRVPGYLTANRKTTTVRFTASTPQPSTSSPSTSPPLAPPTSMLGSGSSIRFRFTEAHGAALVTKYQTYRENVQEVGKFEKYAKENHASWVEFASNAGYGDVNPVLVTGVDRTKDFAMMCYSDYDHGLECQFKTLAPGIAPTSAWGAWETTRPIYENLGPQLCRPPTTQNMDLTLSSGNPAGTVSDEFNQCVFIRYFRMITRKLRAPKIIKAAAGPHDLGTGGHDGEEWPLQAQYDSGSGSDIASSPLVGNWLNDAGSVTSVESEPDIVIHNPTTDERGDFDVIADYIFQNSDAIFALIHHQDIALLPEPGSSPNLADQLLKERPPITVNENGVGRIEPQAGPSAEPWSDIAATPTPESIPGETGLDAATNVALSEPHFSPHPGSLVLHDCTKEVTPDVGQLPSPTICYDLDNFEGVQFPGAGEGDEAAREPVGPPPVSTEAIKLQRPGEGEGAMTLWEWPGLDGYRTSDVGIPPSQPPVLTDNFGLRTQTPEAEGSIPAGTQEIVLFEKSLDVIGEDLERDGISDAGSREDTPDGSEGMGSPIPSILASATKHTLFDLPFNPFYEINSQAIAGPSGSSLITLGNSPEVLDHSRIGKRKRPLEEVGGSKRSHPRVREIAPFGDSQKTLPTAHRWILINQPRYVSPNSQQNWVPQHPIEFIVNGRPGINLTDALDPRFPGPDGRDDQMFLYDGAGNSIVCRIHFPGYPAHSSQIATMDYKKPRNPKTRKKLAFEVAKRINRDVETLKIGLRWEYMILTKLLHVSKASWQPEIWYDPRSSDNS